MNGWEWTKASGCSGATCVEVAFEYGDVLVRDSKDPGGPALAFTYDEWQAFLAGAINGEFDLPKGGDHG